MLKIAIAQMNVLSANPKVNYETMVQHISQAKKTNHDIILFPEMCLPGYFNGDVWEQNSFLLECDFFQNKIAQHSSDITIVFGGVGFDWHNKNEDGRVRKYNGAFIANNNKFILNSKTNLPFWPKTLMPNYRIFDDSRHFYDLRKLAFENKCPLEDLYEPVSIEINKVKYKIGISICEDAWHENYNSSPIQIFDKLAHHDFFVNLSSSPFSSNKKYKRQSIFTQLANQISKPIFYVNCVGVQNIGKTIICFDGVSGVYNENTFVSSSDNQFNSQLISYEKNLENNDGFELCNKNSIAQINDSMAEIHQALEYSIKNICQQWGIQKVVIGISGGIDSALSAVLMSRVLGSKNVFLINMPSQFNSKLTIHAAQKIAQNLGCPYASVDIEQSVQFSKKQFSKIKFSNHPLQISIPVFENIQARDRGARILAAISAALGAVFTCNANKTELTVGYGTLYGDLAGFLCPIGDLWKKDVYALAKYYNEHIFKQSIIPQETLDVVPSAELSANQNVLEGKGDPIHYPYHDYLFQSWVEHWQRKTPEECLLAYQSNELEKLIGCQNGMVQKLFSTQEKFCEDLEYWWNLYQGLGAIKRIQSPPIIALTKRTFGFDHREKIGPAYFTQKYFELKKKNIL